MNITQQDTMIECADNVIQQQHAQLSDNNVNDDDIYVVTACHTCICNDIQCEVRDALKRCATRHNDIIANA
jgi:hypothetical protein